MKAAFSMRAGVTPQKVASNGNTTHNTHNTHTSNNYALFFKFAQTLKQVCTRQSCDNTCGKAHTHQRGCVNGHNCSNLKVCGICITEVKMFEKNNVMPHHFFDTTCKYPHYFTDLTQPGMPCNTHNASHQQQILPQQPTLTISILSTFPQLTTRQTTFSQLPKGSYLNNIGTKFTQTSQQPTDSCFCLYHYKDCIKGRCGDCFFSAKSLDNLATSDPIGDRMRSLNTINPNVRQLLDMCGFFQLSEQDQLAGLITAQKDLQMGLNEIAVKRRGLPFSEILLKKKDDLILSWLETIYPEVARFGNMITQLFQEVFSVVPSHESDLDTIIKKVFLKNIKPFTIHLNDSFDESISWNAVEGILEDTKSPYSLSNLPSDYFDFVREFNKLKKYFGKLIDCDNCDFIKDQLIYVRDALVKAWDLYEKAHNATNERKDIVMKQKKSYDKNKAIMDCKLNEEITSLLSKKCDLVNLVNTAQCRLDKTPARTPEHNTRWSELAKLKLELAELSNMHSNLSKFWEATNAILNEGTKRGSVMQIVNLSKGLFVPKDIKAIALFYTAKNALKSKEVQEEKYEKIWTQVVSDIFTLNPIYMVEKSEVVATKPLATLTSKILSQFIGTDMDKKVKIPEQYGPVYVSGLGVPHEIHLLPFMNTLVGIMNPLDHHKKLSEQKKDLLRRMILGDMDKFVAGCVKIRKTLKLQTIVDHCSTTLKDIANLYSRDNWIASMMTYVKLIEIAFNYTAADALDLTDDKLIMYFKFFFCNMGKVIEDLIHSDKSGHVTINVQFNITTKRNVITVHDIPFDESMSDYVEKVLAPKIVPIKIDSHQFTGTQQLSISLNRLRAIFFRLHDEGLLFAENCREFITCAPGEDPQSPYRSSTIFFTL